jgi:hypothetical protein
MAKKGSRPSTTLGDAPHELQDYVTDYLLGGAI